MINKKAFDFTAQAYHNAEITEVKLSSIDSEYKVLIFYPFDFTFVCPTEINGFSEKQKEFDNLKTKVLFISTDSVYCHKAWTQLNPEDGGIAGCKYPLVSDTTRRISKKFRMLNKKKGVAMRGTVIVDKDLNIRYFDVYDDKVGRSVAEIIRVVENLGFIDSNKDVDYCPVNFKL